MKNEKIRTISTPYGDYSVLVEQKALRNGKSKLLATVIGCQDDRVAKLKRSMKLKANDDIDQKINQLCNRLRAVITDILRSSEPTPSLQSVFEAKIETLPNGKLSYAAWYHLCPPDWEAVSTRDASLRYFARHVLPAISNAVENNAYDAAAAARIATEILDDVVANRSRRDTRQDDDDLNADWEQAELMRSKFVANGHIRDCNALYSALRNAMDDPYRYPEVRLPLFEGAEYIPPEKCKSLLRNILVTFAALLRMSVKYTPLSLGGALMLCGLLRTAEAVCPKYKDILIRGNYAVYGVVWQGNGDVRIADLKTDSSYRLVILPKFAVDCILMRREHLLSLNYTPEQINELYVVSDPDDYTKPAKPAALSRYIRHLLALVGCNDEFWASARDLMLAEPDIMPNGKPIKEVEAYVLRRSGCTYLCNCAAVDPRIVDVIMGHLLRRQDRDLVDILKNEDMWATVADQLESIVYDPAHSAHPAFLPRQTAFANPNSAGKAVAHEKFRLVVTEEMAAQGSFQVVVHTLGSCDVQISYPKERPISTCLATPNTGVDTAYPALTEELRTDFFAACIQSAEKI